MTDAKQSLVGKKNAYGCPSCFKNIITVDRDAGVTPFMIECRATQRCTGFMKSSFYQVDQDLEPTFEWVIPSERWIKTQSEGARDHFNKGGLFIRHIGELSEMTDTTSQTVKVEPKIGRNALCPCGSKKKFKKCHGGRDGETL